jgi:hypothetical protein
VSVKLAVVPAPEPAEPLPVQPVHTYWVVPLATGEPARVAVMLSFQLVTRLPEGVAVPWGVVTVKVSMAKRAVMVQA